MRCIHCGNATNPSSAFCEICGKKNEGPAPALCTHCGKPAEGGDVFCYYCGGKLAGAGGASPMATGAMPTYSSFLSCTRCTGAMDPGDVFCENCGHKNEGDTAPTQTHAPSSSCTRCGGAMEPGDVFCEGCGHKAAGGASHTEATAAVYTTPVPVAPPVRTATQPRMSLVFLLDTSASAGAHINQLSNCLNGFKTEVSLDEQAKSILDVSVVQFSDDYDIIHDFIPVESMNPVRLISGGGALYSVPIRKVLRMVEGRVSYQAESYKPWVILITGGGPEDDISAIAGEVRNLQKADRLRFMALGTQGYDAASLKQLTDVVFRLDGTDFTNFFDWVGKCIRAIAQSQPGGKPQLPPLEGNVYRDV